MRLFQVSRPLARNPRSGGGCRAIAMKNMIVAVAIRRKRLNSVRAMSTGGFTP